MIVQSQTDKDAKNHAAIVTGGSTSHCDWGGNQPGVNYRNSGTAERYDTDRDARTAAEPPEYHDTPPTRNHPKRPTADANRFAAAGWATTLPAGHEAHQLGT